MPKRPIEKAVYVATNEYQTMAPTTLRDTQSECEQAAMVGYGCDNLEALKDAGVCILKISLLMDAAFGGWTDPVSLNVSKDATSKYVFGFRKGENDENTK